MDFWVSDMMQLSHKRKVTVQEFKGKPLVSLREFFTKEGKELPTSKGTLLFPIITALYVLCDVRQGIKFEATADLF